MGSRRQPFPYNISSSRVMIFVDGENLAIRYAESIGNLEPLKQVKFRRSVYVWSHFLNFPHHTTCDIIRKYYYTALKGDQNTIDGVISELKDLGIEAPRVFKKYKTRGSKRVDISLAVDMLMHASRKNYDVAVLVGGDEDYVPLVDAVMSEGRRVCLWFLENGLSPLLKTRVDHYFDLGHVLLDEHADRYF